MTIIKIRSDIKSEWESPLSITPDVAEFCYETDTETLKIGDGVHKFKDIPNHFVTSKEVNDLKTDTDKNLTELQSRKQDVIPKYTIDSDSYVYSELEKMKRSTFDRSKFSVIGNPLISEEGITSKFGAGTPRILSVNTLNAKSIKIKTKANINNITGGGTFWCTGDYSGVLYNGGHIFVKLSSNGISNDISSIGDITSLQVPAGQDVWVVYDWDGTTHKIGTSLDSITYNFYTLATGNAPIYINNLINIGAGGSQGTLDGNIFNGSIDLKQFSITVDGVEVFSGNQTGVDQIKKNDYTVIGSPNISADGIAKDNFSDTNRIFAYIPQTTNNVKIYFNYKRKEIAGNIIGINTSPGLNSFNIYSNNIGQFLAGIRVTDGTTETQINASAQSEFPTRDRVDGILEWDGTTYTYTLKQESTNTTKIFKINSNLPLATKRISIGDSCEEADLNDYKIYIDGNLVYQPTLRIPYTLSKTNEKIVDAVYRNRVQDMYEQFGYTHYYTIGDEPEKYNVQVVGNPTLVGGVASGFSSSNYLKNNINITPATNLIIKNKFTIGASTSAQMIYTFNNTDVPRISVESATEIRLSGIGTALKVIVPTLTQGQIIETKTILYSNNIKLEVYINGQLYSNDRDESITFTNLEFVTLGALRNGGYPFTGTIDLSQFSIEVDGKEVFRGYEPAITDAFTLATNKGVDVIESYSDGAGTYYEVRADLVQRCVGQIPPTSTEVNYPRPFRDADNIVQVSYFDVGESTATPTIAHIAPKLQTKDGFTIGATTNLKRNYYAEGKAVLG